MIQKAKSLLLKFIKEKGAIVGDIINVEQFLNHQVEPLLLSAITEAFAEILKGTEFTKIITVESSGIPRATALSLKLNKPFLFFKKKKPITMKDYFEAESYSFTKQVSTKLYLSKHCIEEGENVVVVDDFYANGDTHKAIKSLAEVAGFNILKYIVVFNKSDNEEIFSLLNKNLLRDINNEKQ